MEVPRARFTNKVAFITGAGQGIGEEYAKALAAEGAAVVIADIDQGAGERVAAAMRQAGQRALAVTCNVADRAGVADAVERSIAAFGGIDILINNAAKHLMEFNVPPTALPLDKWREMLDVNVVGIVNCSAACRATMRQRGGGVIVNQGSIAGFMSTTPYGISKLAVRGLTVALAQEFAADKIRVYCIAPGLVDSPAADAEVPKDMRDRLVSEQQLVKRHGRMSDLVGPLLFFCSDEASFVTGETLMVSGGFPLRV
jgi:NAD(P)-dependent dehydrogenase (short-subunit alcohol dehydrogenase family)